VGARSVKPGKIQPFLHHLSSIQEVIDDGAVVGLFIAEFQIPVEWVCDKAQAITGVIKIARWQPAQQ